jgi:hypothetical protein
MSNIPSFATLRVILLLALITVSTTLAAPDPQIIKTCTTTTKAEWHVVFGEIIKSKSQRDWTDVYSATVELYHNGVMVGSFHGSTLPNNKPTSAMPADWQYSVVTATCALPKLGEQQLFYKWTRGKRADGQRPCLRLASKVPTVNVGSAREADKFIDFLIKGSADANYFYANDILVHSGWSTESRGSAGCLTIHPDNQQQFFGLIPEGANGTLEIDRGIEDESTQSSYCY